MFSSTLRSIFGGDIHSSSTAVGLTDADINRLDTDLLLVEESISHISNGARRLAQGMRPLMNQWSSLNDSLSTTAMTMEQRYQDLEDRCSHLEEKLRRSDARCHHLEMVIADLKSTCLASIDERFRHWEQRLRNANGAETKSADGHVVSPSLETRMVALEEGVRKALDVMLPRVNELLTRYEGDSDAPMRSPETVEVPTEKEELPTEREEVPTAGEEVPTAAAVSAYEELPAESPRWFFPWSDAAVDEDTKALCEAAKKGKLGKVLSLLHSGVNVNARDCIGYSALYVASIYGREKVIALLLRKGADVHCRGCGGKTALHCAAMNGHAACIPLLVQGGAHVRARDHSGWTPLHHASANGHPDAVRALLAVGARACARDTEGLTPADFARKPEVVNLLLGAGGNGHPLDIAYPAVSSL